MAITTYHHIAVATSIMLLRLLSVAVFWVQLRTLDFSCEGFKLV